MNTTKRYLMGVFSGLLLAVGLARAADRFDPLAADAARNSGGAEVVTHVATPTVMPCNFVEE